MQDDRRTNNMAQESGLARQDAGIEILKDAAQEASKKWYVLRYMTLSKRMRDILLTRSSMVFFPQRSVRSVQSGKSKIGYTQQALVPGYIFVNGTLNEAKQLGKEMELNLWRKKNNGFIGNEYHTISDKAMHVLKCAVAINAMDFKLLDAGCIDLTKDDLVEITAEGYNRQRGYIKYVNKQNDGLVVVPLQDDSEGAPQTLFHYGIPVRAADVTIISFADGSRRATDLLNHANKTVDGIMEAYRQGNAINGKDETRLIGYIHRFRNLQLDRPIQRARHTLMLYRIYTILEFKSEGTEMRRLLEDEILPECQQRMLKANDRDKASAANTLQEYLTLKLEADTAYQTRQEALILLSQKQSLSQRRLKAI